MDLTVFYTVTSGVLTFVVGQVFVKLVLDPVHEAKRTIGQVSHSLIEYANVIANPGVPKVEVMQDASRQLRRLSSQLHSHLYLVPLYGATAVIFRLPSRSNLLAAARSLIGLSNGLHRATESIYEANARNAQNVCDKLGIYVPPEDRWEPPRT
jgi:hypothetical protein